MRPPTGEALLDKIQALSPKDDRQRWLQAQALNLSIGLGQTRWLMYQQTTTSVSKPMVAFLVFWLRETLIKSSLSTGSIDKVVPA
jgi:hypothetical protein